MKSLKLLVVMLFTFVALGVAQSTTPPQNSGATPVQPVGVRPDVVQFIAHSHTTSGTITAAASPNQSFYLTGMDISDCEGTAVTAAAPTYMIVTGLLVGAGSSPQWQIGSGPATAGTCSFTPVVITTPIKAIPNTAVVFTLPAFITNQVVSVNIYGFYGPA